jgi:hypothetical protein
VKQTISKASQIMNVRLLYVFLFPVCLMAQSVPSQIPATYFGIHNPGDWPSVVKVGNFRQTSGQIWSLINTCPSGQVANCRSAPQTYSTFSWGGFDSLMASVYKQGVADVEWTLYNTPDWAAGCQPVSGVTGGRGCSSAGYCDNTSLQSGGNCTDQCAGGGFGGQWTCYEPGDIKLDGSGENRAWDNWIVQMALHVNNPTYLQSHPGIEWWETDNEWENGNPVINGQGAQTNAYSHVNYAEELRNTEDLRCILLGTGTIHNYPAAGNSSETCSAYLQHLNSEGIDPKTTALYPGVKIIGPSNVTGEFSVFPNFLYCNHSPVNELTSTTTSCTWSGGLNWGANAIDIVDYHFYLNASGNTPENTLPGWVNTYVEGNLQTNEKNKPLWDGEGSCGWNTDTIWGDDFSRATFVPRYFAMNWSLGVTQVLWYRYDQGCPLINSGNVINNAGTAWNTTYRWLVDSTPSSPFCTHNGTVYTCTLTESNGKQAEMVWDAKFGPGGSASPSSCANATGGTPYQSLCCNSGSCTSYSVPSQYKLDWVDLSGASHSYSPTVQVGAGPILLEGGGSVPVTGPVKVTGAVKLTGSAEATNK